MKPTTIGWHISPGTLLTVALLIGGAWLLLRWLRGFFEQIARVQPRMRFLIRQVEPALRILIWFSAFFISAQLVAPTPDAFLAALGSVAIAIALGAQDLVKNLVGGLVIVADRPYQTGDRVKIGDAYGEIEHIGLRSTKLMTPDDTLVTIPNAEILSNFAHNANAGVPECLVVTDLFLPPTIDPDLALSIGREVAVTCPFTHLGRRIAIKLEDSFSEEPFMTLKIKAYVYDHRHEPAMQSDIVRRAKREFIDRGLLNAWNRT
jgi:small-conductance mechanosensitive channel